MRNILAAFVVAFLVVACSTPQPLPPTATPAQQSYYAREVAKIALRDILVYLRRPACSATVVVGCKHPDIAENLKQAATAISTATGEGGNADLILSLSRAALNAAYNAAK
jgi:hypothetical protein